MKSSKTKHLWWLVLLIIPIGLIIWLIVSASKNGNSATLTQFRGFLPSGWPRLPHQDMKLIQLSSSPMLAQVDNVLTPNECKALVTLMDTSKKWHYDGMVVRNKMAFVDLDYKQCKAITISRDSPIMQKIFRRLSAMTSLPISHFEQPRLIKYKEGGFFKVHHDQNTWDPPRIRVLSMVIYLNDVPEGGSTNFPRLNVEVRPKAGRGSFWYNVSPDGYSYPETAHEGRPVTKGEKYCLIIWGHNLPFES